MEYKDVLKNIKVGDRVVIKDSVIIPDGVYSVVRIDYGDDDGTLKVRNPGGGGEHWIGNSRVVCKYSLPNLSIKERKNETRKH